MNWKRIFLITITFAVVPSLMAVGVGQHEVQQATYRAAAEAEVRRLAQIPAIPAVQPTVPTTSSNTDINEGPIDLNAEDYLAISNELKSLVDTQNPRVALQQLEDLMNKDKKVLRSCHGLGHAIGHWGFKKYGNFADAMSYLDDVCGNSYMHGVIEEDFVNVSDIVTTMKSLCAPNAWGCFHAIGHGLMYYKKNDLPEALKLCANLSGPYDQAYCWEGVFMENFETNTMAHKALYLKPEDPFYPCYESQYNGYEDVCYYYSGRYVVRVSKDDYIGALRRCEQAPEAQFSTSCARGVGAVTVRQNLSEPKAVEFVCSQGPVSLASSCLYGATSYYSVTYQSAAYTKQHFCGEFSNPYYADQCRSFAGNG